jgi:hypothetical protein
MDGPQAHPSDTETQSPLGDAATPVFVLSTAWQFAPVPTSARIIVPSISAAGSRIFSLRMKHQRRHHGNQNFNSNRILAQEFG